MKYLRQFGIIMLISFLGDVCHELIPVPIPGSIYGMILLLAALWLKLLKVENLRETGSYLISLLPLLFVAPTVGLVTCWDSIQTELWEMLVVVVVTTILTFGISGLLTKHFSKGGADDE